MSDGVFKKLALVLALGAALAGCRGCHDEGSSADAAPVGEAEVPVPEGLLAEATLLDPNAAWSRVQRGVGGAVALLPMTLGGLVCTLAGIDPALAQEVDGTTPAYGVIATSTVDAGDPFAWAVAVHLAEPRRARIVLVDGETARYKTRDEGGLAVLVSKGLPLSAAVALAPSGWLVVANDATGLARLGPYTYKNLPKRPKKDGSLVVDVPHAATARLADELLAPKWAQAKKEMEDADHEMRAAHGGRAPDFGDPAAILKTADAFVTEKLDVLRDLDHVHLTIDAGDDAMKAVLALTPRSGSGPASQAIAALHLGDAAPMLDAPSDASLVVLTRSDAASRTTTTKGVEDALDQALGERITAAEKQDLHGALAAWAAGSGDWVTAALAIGKPTGIVVRTAATDADGASHAAHLGAELLGRPVFRGPLEAALDVRGVALGSAEAPPLGKVELLSVARRDPKAPPLGAMWGAHDGSFFFAAGDSPTALVALGAAPARRLRDDARVAATLNALGPDVGFALLARSILLGLGAAASGNTTPFVAAVGRTGGNGWLRVEISDPLVREAIRRAGGF